MWFFFYNIVEGNNKYMKSLFSFILVTLLILFSSFSQTPDAQSFYENGVENISNKNYIGAIADFTNALSEKPDFGAAYFQRAIAKHELALSAGYESVELCMDLSQALNLGEEKAIPLIKNHCQNECYKMEMAFYQPEMVFCADFSSKVLYDLPKDAYYKLINLTKLNLFNNKFEEIPKNFIDLNLLVQLDMSSNRLTELQPIVGTLVYLEELKLNKNMITELPNEIGNLKLLKNLQLKGNRLMRVPKTFAKLSNLEYLDLSGNQINSLPDDLSKWTKLKTLLVMGNSFGKKEQKRIQDALPNCTIYF